MHFRPYRRLSISWTHWHSIFISGFVCKLYFGVEVGKTTRPFNTYTSQCSVTSNSKNSWTVARQAPLSMGLSQQEYWSALPFLQGNLPNPRIKPTSPVAPTGRFFTTEPPGEPYFGVSSIKIGQLESSLGTSNSSKGFDSVP